MCDAPNGSQLSCTTADTLTCRFSNLSVCVALCFDIRLSHNSESEIIQKQTPVILSSKYYTMVCCAICKADNNKKCLKRSFHCFPKDDHLCKLWIEATGRKNWTPKHAVLCSEHFDAKDFIRFGAYVRLRKGAIPNVRAGSASAGITAAYLDQHEVRPGLILQKIDVKKINQVDRMEFTVSANVSGSTPTSSIGVLPEDVCEGVAIANSSGGISVEMREEFDTKSYTDHTYFSTKENPNVKKDWNALNRRNLTMAKQLKTSRQKVRRLQKRVGTLKSVNAALKKKLHTFTLLDNHFGGLPLELIKNHQRGISREEE